MGWICPECGREGHSYRSYSAHYRKSHDGHALVAYVGEDRLAELYQDHSEKALAERFGVARTAMKAALEEIGTSRRGQSDAEALKWSQMSDEERRKQVEAAHEATRTHPRLGTNVNGYERVRHCQEEVKHHRLLAVAHFGFDEVVENVVHHKNGLTWDNRPDNLELLSQSEHMAHHYQDREIDERGRLV